MAEGPEPKSSDVGGPGCMPAIMAGTALLGIAGFICCGVSRTTPLGGSRKPVEVGCDFCTSRYEISVADLEQLVAETTTAEG